MTKKLAIITGGSKGIGRALVKEFAAHGFDIATCSRNILDLENLKNEIEAEHGIKVLAMQTDVAHKEQVLAFADKIKESFDSVDVLINNAGVFIPGAIHEEEDGAVEKMINTNLYSAYHLTRALVGQMKRDKKGHIFNICSTASIIPYVNGGSYCISKFALYGMSKVLREEMKEFGVKVTSVLPGATLTSSWEGVELPADRFMSAEDVATAVYDSYKLSDRTVIEELVLRPQLGDI